MSSIFEMTDRELLTFADEIEAKIINAPGESIDAADLNAYLECVAEAGRREQIFENSITDSY